jgi:hypothetical protein
MRGSKHEKNLLQSGVYPTNNDRAFFPHPLCTGSGIFMLTSIGIGISFYSTGKTNCIHFKNYLRENLNLGKTTKLRNKQSSQQTSLTIV